jgi:integral membrane protein
MLYLSPFLFRTQMFNNSIRTLRIIGILEGISFLVLLCIAMPLKYLMDIPQAVKVVGWAHGVLFMAYIPAVFLARRAMQWNFFQVVVALAASLIPLGTFFMDRQLSRREKELVQNG